MRASAAADFTISWLRQQRSRGVGERANVTAPDPGLASDRQSVPVLRNAASQIIEDERGA